MPLIDVPCQRRVLRRCRFRVCGSAAWWHDIQATLGVGGEGGFFLGSGLIVAHRCTLPLHDLVAIVLLSLVLASVKRRTPCVTTMDGLLARIDAARFGQMLFELHLTRALPLAALPLVGFR